MRIQPMLLTAKSFVNNANYNGSVRQNGFNSLPMREENHVYTGVASVDLAYASMFDMEIARDLKLMGLI